MKLGKVYYKNPPIRRIKRRFAYLPKILSNNDKIWLEHYYSYEIYAYKGFVLNGHQMGSATWNKEFLSSTLKELRDYLKIDYKEKKRLANSTKEFFEFLNKYLRG